MPLETWVEAWETGTLPEDFVRDCSHLNLADISAILAYCLRHQEEVRDYLANQKRKAEVFSKGNPYAASSIRAKLQPE